MHVSKMWCHQKKRRETTYEEQIQGNQGLETKCLCMSKPYIAALNTSVGKSGDEAIK